MKAIRGHMPEPAEQKPAAAKKTGAKKAAPAEKAATNGRKRKQS